MAVEYEDGARFSGSEPVGVDELNKALLGGRLVFNDWGGISTFDAIKTVRPQKKERRCSV